ncbi:MAG: serine hydroxymethyltransferase, partial [Longicatena sp.]
NHLILVDVKSSIGMNGKVAEHLLDEAGITCNKNTIPFETEKPFVTSGIRLGTAAMTTRGFKEEEFKQVALWISKVLKNADNEELIKEVHKEVCALTENFPLPNEK